MHSIQTDGKVVLSLRHPLRRRRISYRKKALLLQVVPSCAGITILDGFVVLTALDFLVKPYSIQRIDETQLTLPIA